MRGLDKGRISIRPRTRKTQGLATGGEGEWCKTKGSLLNLIQQSHKTPRLFVRLVVGWEYKKYRGMLESNSEVGFGVDDDFQLGNCVGM
jgi:hypothetical protein